MTQKILLNMSFVSEIASAPSISQESFNVETIRKYYQEITDLKNKYDEKQRKYKNAHNKLLNTSTAASSVGVVSCVSSIRTAFTCCRLTNKCVIRCCEHCFNLCGWNSVINF